MVEGFKHTEIGMIPSDWEVKKIVENSTMKARIGWQGLTVSEYLDRGDYFLITGTDFVEGKIKWDTCHFVEKSRYDQDKNIQIKEGDILITKDGTIGKIAFVDELPMPATLNSGVFVIRPKKNDNYVPQFLFHIFNSFYFNDFLNRLTAGSTIVHLYQKDFTSFNFPLPTLAEQTAIATALNDADALIQKLEQLISKKRYLKTGAMQELLRPKEGWEVKKLGEIGECIIGLTYSPSNVKSEGKLVLRSSNIKGNRLAYEDNVFVDVQVSERLIVRKGDILICVRNGSRNLIGKCAYIDGKAIGETFGAFMSVFRSPYNDFVFHAFQSHCIQRQIEETIGATINQLTNKNLNSFEIPFPNPIEQTRIACILSDMDNEIQALETQLEQYKRVKQGMMQSLLTGKIRLV